MMWAPYFLTVSEILVKMIISGSAAVILRRHFFKRRIISKLKRFNSVADELNHMGVEDLSLVNTVPFGDFLPVTGILERDLIEQHLNT